MENEINLGDEETKQVAEAMGKGMDLLEEFLSEFGTGVLGADKRKAQAEFLHRHGLNSNPDVLDD